MKATACRKAYFNAAHRLHNDKWDSVKNRNVFGVCNNPNYHGHNYTLVVKVTGEIDPDTGYVIDIKVLKEIINTQVIERFDHKNLNVDVIDFKNLNPSAENIAVVIWNLIKKQLPHEMDLHIVLYETERNFVEYSGT